MREREIEGGRERVRERERVTRKLVRSRLKWAGHVERMEGVRLTKRTDSLRVEGRRGRPRLRRENYVKRDLAEVGGEWRMRAKERGEWRRD